MDLMHAIASIPGIGPFLPWIMAVMSIATALAPFVPPDWPIYRIVNVLAANVGQARNFSDPKV